MDSKDSNCILFVDYLQYLQGNPREDSGDTQKIGLMSRIIDIISSIFSDNSGMKLEINYRKRNQKKMITWRLNEKTTKKPMGKQ